MSEFLRKKNELDKKVPDTIAWAKLQNRSQVGHG